VDQKVGSMTRAVALRGRRVWRKQACYKFNTLQCSSSTFSCKCAPGGGRPAWLYNVLSAVLRPAVEHPHHLPEVAEQVRLILQDALQQAQRGIVFVQLRCTMVNLKNEQLQLAWLLLSCAGARY